MRRAFSSVVSWNTTTTPLPLGHPAITAVYNPGGQSLATDDSSTGTAALEIDYTTGDLIVSQVGFMDDAGHVPQHRVGYVVAVQDRLEAAVAAVMGQLDASHVERGGVTWDPVGVVDEDVAPDRDDQPPMQTIPHV